MAEERYNVENDRLERIHTIYEKLKKVDKGQLVLKPEERKQIAEELKMLVDADTKRYISDNEASSKLEVAEVEAKSKIETARIDAQLKREIAQVEAVNRKEVAFIEAKNRREVALIEAENRKEVAQIEAGSRKESPAKWILSFVVPAIITGGLAAWCTTYNNNQRMTRYEIQHEKDKDFEMRGTLTGCNKDTERHYNPYNLK